MTIEIRPVPSDEEAAAIAAAVELSWPRAVVVDEAAAAPSNRWRFSGRWWTGPLARTRQRP
ncbi:MAG: hypothetical protein ACRBI6_20550 [Acidimicrobiales bacterium]